LKNVTDKVFLNRVPKTLAYLCSAGDNKLLECLSQRLKR